MQDRGREKIATSKFYISISLKLWLTAQDSGSLGYQLGVRLVFHFSLVKMLVQ